MGICTVSHDLAVYEAQVDAAEAEEEFYNCVAADLIAEFEREGACSLQTGQNQQKQYNQSHLLANLFDHTLGDQAAEAFRLALDSNKTAFQRLQAAHQFFKLAEEQMTEDLEMLSTELWIDDSP